MTTVESYTKAKVDALIGATIVDAHVVAGELILTKEDSSTINVGSVGGIQKKTAFPTVPAPADGDMVVRTDQVGDPLYKFTDGVWEQQPRMGARTVPTAQAYSATDNFVSVPSAVVTAVPFSAELFDTDTMHDVAVNTGRLTIKTPGLYNISGRLVFDSNGSGIRQLMIRLNGTVIADKLVSNLGASFTVALDVSFTRRLAAGDYVDIVVYQDSGSAILLRGLAAQTALTATWLGGAGQTVDERGASAARLQKTVTQSVPNTTYTQINLDTVTYDTDGMSTTANRLIAKTPGLYRVSAEVDWANNQTGARQIALRKNGSSYFGFVQGLPSSAGGGTYQQIVGEVMLAAGDYITLEGWQSSTAALSVDGGFLTASLVATGKTVTPYVSAHLPATLSNLFATGVWTLIPFAGEASDNDGIHDTVSNTSRLVCRTAGIYAVQGNVVFSTQAGGTRRAGIFKNGAEQDYFLSGLPATSGSGTYIPLSAIVELAVGDYIEIMAFQDSGSAVSCLGDPSYDGDRTYLKMVKVGSPSSPSVGLGPAQADVFTLATLPAANTVPPGRIIFVSDGAAGQQARMSTGAAWINLG